MHDRTPDRSTLDPAEVMDREQLGALQLERMRWSLGHAYANVAPTRAAFDAAGVQGCSGSPTTCAPLWSGPSITGSSSSVDQSWSPPVVAGGTLFARLDRLRAYRSASA